MIYDSGEWPDDFLTMIMIPLEKKNNARKCTDYRTISLISQAAMILLRKLNKRLQGKVDEYLGEEQFGFRKGTRDAIAILRTVVERYIEKGRTVYVVLIDLEKAFDRVVWDKLLEILKK